MTPKLAYTINEAVDSTGLGRSTIYSLINSGQLASAKVGRRTLISAASLRTLLKLTPSQ